jgi:hypothetical protein
MISAVITDFGPKVAAPVMKIPWIRTANARRNTPTALFLDIQDFRGFPIRHTRVPIISTGRAK